MVVVAFAAIQQNAWALGEPKTVAMRPVAGGFTLVEDGKTAPLLVSAEDWPGVLRAANSLRAILSVSAA